MSCSCLRAQRFCGNLFLLLGICLVVSPLLAAPPVPTNSQVPKGYQLAWNDEFDGSELDLKKWQYRYLGKRENAVISKEAISLDGKGHLRLTTFKKGDDLLTGMIGTQPTFQQKYGYFEARIQFQKQQGHHGAFWLQSPNYGKVLNDPGACGAEIDIIEFFGSGRSDRGAGITVHWNPYPKTDKETLKPALDPILGKKPANSPGKELCDDFHVYGLLWTKKEYVFFIDDKEFFRTAKGLSHQPQYIVLSLLSSDWERKRLEEAKLPDAMLVDYVRVYANKD